MDSILTANSMKFTNDMTIDKVFEQTVEKYPNSIAIKSKNKSYNYETINILANQLAHFIKKKGIKPEDKIGILLDRSVELGISILAVLKVGCTCVLIDSELPKERVKNFILEADLKAIISDNPWISMISFFEGNKIICNLDYAFPYGELKSNLNIEIDIHDPAFIFFTSGSSGKPKGVIITHGAIINDTHPEVAQPALDANDTFLMTSPVGSTRITGELFYPWFAGTKIIILPDENSKNIKKLIQIIYEENITVIFIVPTMLRTLLNDEDVMKCKCLKFVHSLGEKLPKSLRDKFREILDAQLINIYGQTEAGICTMHFCDTNSQESYVTSGKPVINRCIYILDDNLQPVKNGDVGNIYIGGSYLATGYLNDAMLTTERFVKDTISSSSTAIMYKTGDVGRINSKSNLEYLGRDDQIVKVSGNRVSLLEIEAILLSYDFVQDAVVKVTENNFSETMLVAVIETDLPEQLKNTNWRKRLEAKIPTYMIPNKFIFVKEFPKLPSGKVDHQNILEKIINNNQDINEKQKMTIMENKIAELWCEILQIPKNRIKLEDKFLELGGNSILSVKCIAEIEKKFQNKIEFNVFYNATLKELANIIQEF
ncbi:TPA: non-ribosomal peptide synthetase [Bacillus anthracis]|nr:non-ribosomal peptide synthetase [Bacillus anthracis]